MKRVCSHFIRFFIYPILLILTCGKAFCGRPFGLPSFWRAEAAQMNGHIRPSSRPQAMKGSPEGRVPLAPSAEDRPPRRRIKRQSPTLTSIYACTKSLPTAPHVPFFSVLPSMHVSLPDAAWHGLRCPARRADNTADQEAIPAGSPSR